MPLENLDEVHSGCVVLSILKLFMSWGRAPRSRIDAPTGHEASKDDRGALQRHPQ